MAWRRAGPRPFWRSIVDALVFLSVLFIVLMVLNRYNMIDLGTGEYVAVDGDSLRKGQTEIRLVGIDAPEYRQTCTDHSGVQYPCGKDAATALRTLVSSGEVNCESHDVDRYHRALSTCRVKTQIINRELVRQGWAVAYAPHGPAFDYVTDETEARRLKRGIWQGSFEQPSDYRKRQRTMQGNVTGTSEPDD
jgi:endonuclease YncB( thermonuclease family)